MASYHYMARDRSGQSVSGRLDLPSRAQALRRLRSQGLTPVSLAEVPLGQPSEARQRPPRERAARQGTAPSARRAVGARGVPREREVDEFLRILLGLLKGGMTIGDAVRQLRDRAASAPVRALAEKVWARLSDGATLGGALREAAPSARRETMNAVIEIGEQTGNLPPILAELVEQRAEARAVRKKLVGSLLYPGFLFLMAVLVAAFLLFFLMPQVRSTVEGLGSGLSPMATFLLGASNLLLLAAPLLGTLLVLAGLGAAWMKRREGGAARLDRWILRLPLVGGMVKDAEVFRVCSLLSLLLGSGIHASEAFLLTRQSLRNRELQRRFEEVRQEINEGAYVAVSLRQHDVLHPTAADLLKVGEETGELAEGFANLRNDYRDSLSERLRRLTLGVSGCAIGGAFLFVAMVALAVVTSIFQVGNSIGL